MAQVFFVSNFGQMTSALQKSQCCSATPAAQHSENCSATSVFACGMLHGVGFIEGWAVYEQRRVDLATFRAVPASTWGHCPQVLCFTTVWDTPGKEEVAKWSSAPASILEGFNEIYAFTGPKNPTKQGKNVRSEKLQNESFPNFSIFRAEFCSEFFPNFLRIFRASFRGRRTPEKIHQKSPTFFNAKFPGKHEKNYSQNSSGEQAK